MSFPLSGIRILDLSRRCWRAVCTNDSWRSWRQRAQGRAAASATTPAGGPRVRRGGAERVLLVGEPQQAPRRSTSQPATARGRCGLSRPVPTSWSTTSSGGTLERWGIAPATCSRPTRRLIWCTITGFRPCQATGPATNYRGGRPRSGWMAITGEPHGAPMEGGRGAGRCDRGQDAAIAILARWRASARRRGGAPASGHLAGAQCDVALVNAAQNALASGGEPPRGGGMRIPTSCPTSCRRARPPPRDRGRSDAQFAACMRRWARRLADDDRYRTNAGRLAHREAIVTAMRERVGTRPAAAWQAALDAAGVPCGVVKPVLRHCARWTPRRSPASRRSPRVPCVVHRRCSMSTARSCARADGGRSTVIGRGGDASSRGTAVRPACTSSSGRSEEVAVARSFATRSRALPCDSRRVTAIFITMRSRPLASSSCPGRLRRRRCVTAPRGVGVPSLLAIGTGFTMGEQSGGVVHESQLTSWPAQLAARMEASFRVPRCVRRRARATRGRSP